MRTSNADHIGRGSIAFCNSLLKNFTVILFLLVACGYSVAAQTISGTITDKSGEPLIGVTVLESGTTNGTTTDIDGSYSLNLSTNTTSLIVQYLGYKTERIAVDGRSTIDIQMTDDVQVLDEVFVSATSKPIRRIEATTAIESISSKEIERMNPTGLMDIVRYTPGVFVQNKAGRTRNFIFIRGFPDGSSNGMLYTSFLMDGLKTFGSTEMVPDAAFRNDLNVEKVEVVRGTAATLFGRGAAAGAVNVITRTGGETTSGTIKATVGNNSWYQLDANINGAISSDKSWRYNLGGFYLTDRGYRNGPHGDKGYQFRANIDKLFSGGGKFRLSAGIIDLDVNNYLDIPYEISDLSKPAGDWQASDVVLQEDNPWVGSAWPVTVAGQTASNEYDEWYPRGNFSQGYSLGFELDLPFGDGWNFNNKGRFQNMLVGVSFDFPINNVGGSGNNSVNTFGDTQLRAIIGGGLSNGGSDSRDFINELRLTKSIDGGSTKHNLTLGGYLSLFNVHASADGALYTVNTTSPTGTNESLNTTPFGSVFGLSFRNSTSDENTFSFFVGDEITFNDRFTLNIGGRYDAINIDITENEGTSGAIVRPRINHSGFSASAGFNYLITPLTAIYGNIARSYRAPDFGTYTPLRDGPTPGTFDKPVVEENENVTSFEFGYRKSTDNWSFDGGLFWSDITNRRVATFIDAIATQVPAGDNHIRGAEVSFIYTPQSAYGLYIRNSFTVQTTNITNFSQALSYTDPNNPDNTISEVFDFEGNDLPDVPPFMWNLSIGYSTDKFGFNIHNNFIAARWADPYNSVKYPSRSLINANISYNIADNFKIQLSSTNLLNTQKISSAISVRGAASPTLYVASLNNFQGNFRHTFGIPLLPRRIMATAQYSF